MQSKSNNIEMVLYDNANEVVNEVFELIPSKYQSVLEISMRGINFIFNSAQLMY